MSDEPRKPRRPAPQRPPGELAELLAAMSEEAGETQPRPRARRPVREPEAPVRQPDTAPPSDAAPPPPPPPRPSEPAPRLEQPAPEPPSEGGWSAQAPEEPAPAPAVPESDVVAGMPLSESTQAPESFLEDSDADLPPAMAGPRARSRTSGRVGQRDSRGRRPSRAGRSARSGRPPAGRGLEPPRVRSRGQQRLRLALVGGGLLIVAIVLIAVLGSSGGTHHPATAGASTPLRTQSATPLPAPRTSSTTTTTTTRRSTPPPAAAPTLRGASRDVLLIPRLLPGRAGARAIAVARASLVVIDPDNGPGRHPVKALAAQVTAVRHAGGQPLAYVATARGRRSAHAVLAEMGRYRRWYGVRDVYLAGAATGVRELGYYRRLARDARSHGARLVVLDSGAVPAHGYFALANVIVTFAGSYRSYLRVRFPRALAPLAADRQANLITGAATAGDARHALALARRRGVGLAFVSSGSGPRALGAVPAYLGHERTWLAGSGSR